MSSPYKQSCNSNEGRQGGSGATNDDETNLLDAQVMALGRGRNRTVLPLAALAGLAPTDDTEVGRQRSIVERNGNIGRKISDDYTRRAYALSDTHFGQASQFKRESINSNKTIEVASDESDEVDELYRSGSESS